MPEPRSSRRWPKVLGAVVLVLLLLAAVAVLALDRVLLSQARKQAVELSAELGRPVTIGGVETKLWGGVGARVTDVAIGAGEGEDVPLATLRLVEVEADLVRAVRTTGKEIHVREARAEGLTVNVVKLADGTTNAERVAKALAPTEEKDAAPPGSERAPQPVPSEQPPIRVLQVDRAAIENGRITFRDRTVPGSEELVVGDVDVEVRDLETGKPLELLARAAVLADRQNVELRVKAAPLPASLEPTPEEIVLKVEPIVLDPLAPFLPREVGFRGGRLEADIAAKLGAAVPGGSGPSRVKGAFRATGLAFHGQEGGKPLDAMLDADVEADIAAGDLRIERLELALGPAVVTGKGRASGLRGDSPRFEGLDIVTRGLDPDALAAYYPPLRKQLGTTVVSGPVGLAVRGSGTQESQALEIRVDLTPVRLSIPEQLTKAAGAPMVLLARADVAGSGRPVRFDVSADLGGLDLRPGGTIAKKPGDPLSVKAAGSYLARRDEQEVRLDRVDLALLADRLQGKALLQLAGTGARATTRFDAELHGDRLDLDRLLAPTPPARPSRTGEERTAPAAPPLDPAAFSGLSGTAAIRVGTLRFRKVDARDVALRVLVQGDEVRLEEARLVAFGGSISAAGTHLALARPDAPFEVALDLRGVAGDEVLKLLGDHKVLSGTLDAGVKVGGAGWKLGLLTSSVTGTIDGTLRGGAFRGKDLVASVAAPLAEKLPFAAKRLPERGSTPLGKELPFGFQVKDGLAALTKPLRVEIEEGGLSIDGGGVRLDGTLELPVMLSLAPDVIARITGGRVKPKAPVPVTFRLAGPAWKPRLEALALDAAVRSIVDQAAAGAIGRAIGAEGSSVGEVAEKKRAEAEARAREEAERQRSKVEEEARKRLKGLFGK